MDDKAGGRLGLDRAVAVVVGGYLDIDVVGATVRIGIFDLNVGVVDLSLLVDWKPQILGGLHPLDVGGCLTRAGPGGLAPFGHDALQFGIDPDAADGRSFGEEALDLLPGRPVDLGVMGEFAGLDQAGPGPLPGVEPLPDSLPAGQLAPAGVAVSTL